MPTLTRSTIAKIESGVRRAVTADELAALAAAFGMDPNSLLAEITLTVLHLKELRIGADFRDDLLDRVRALHAPAPDLVVCSGDLTASARLAEFDRALSVLDALAAGLGLDRRRIVLVPGARDVSKPASMAYFAGCEADDTEPQPPYWPKWRHFARLFEEFYQGSATADFDSAQPWTLFTFPELRVAVAGLNSTMALTHRPEDEHGLVGTAQAAWFAERLRAFEHQGWLRLGVVHHPLSELPEAEGILGEHLNLVLNGGGESAEVEVLRLAADALTRWPGEASTERSWYAAHSTFRTPGERDRPAASGQGGDVPERSSPHDDLLSRIGEVCETRFERARVRRVSADPPHLFVTYLDTGIVRQIRIGAHVGEPTAATVEDFLPHVRGDGSDQLAELVYLGPPPQRQVRDMALMRGVRLRSFVEFQGLLDLSGYVRDQTLRLTRDQSYPPELYVPQRFTDLARPDRGVRDDLAGELLTLLRADQGRFLLVLGDPGQGKTFVVREVARRIAAEAPHLVPILIELRDLDRAQSVDQLVAAHLTAFGEELIDLRAFHYMLRQGRIVLLFDGFDELATRVTYDRAADHLATLLEAMQDQAKILVTSRGQHFQSAAQVFTALGERVGLLPQRRVLSIAGFSPTQIRSYLVNRYGSESAADERLRLIGELEDLLGLAQNPRMLGFIADLGPERLRAVTRTRSTVSAADLYREILTSWLTGELERFHGRRGAPTAFTLDDLWRAVETLAVRMWETSESHLRLTELSEVAEALAGLAEERLTTAQATHALGAGSLLVRTDEGRFGFVHGSIAEWLVARRIAAGFAVTETGPPALTRHPLPQLTVDFLCDLADVRACQSWAARVLADPDAGDVPRANAIKITTRLRAPARTSLRGAHIQGEDLSHRDLRGVDLTRADLTDAALVGTDLSGAVLRKAKLRGARLDQARLTGADLRGADLSGARLFGAGLREATISGSRWTRAALVGVDLPPGLPAAPELRDAAVAPPAHASLQTRPATVGVPYGFHPTTGRLPAPVAFSPDGELFAVGGDDGGVVVCEAASGSPVRTLHGHKQRTYAVCYAPPGDRLATGSADGQVRLWDTATGDCLHRLDIHPEGVWPVVFNADGSLLATGAIDGTVRIWDAATGDLRHELAGHRPPIYTVVFTPGGGTVYTGDASATIRAWDLASGRARTLTGHHGAVYRLVISPDGTLLAAGDRQGTVRLWRGDEVHQEFAGHRGRVYTVCFHPDGRVLASGDTDGSIRLWDIVTSTPLRSLDGHTGAVYQTAFTPDGSTLVSADSNGSIRLWDAETGRQRHELSGHRGSVWPFAIRPDGAQLVTTSNDDTARIWDLATGQNTGTLRGHGRRVTAVSFSPDGSALAGSGNDGVVQIWDVATGRRVKQLRDSLDHLVSAAFSPVGDRLVTATSKGWIHLWHSGDWSFDRALDMETDYIWAQAVSPDGELLATANDDDSVRLWFRDSGRMAATLAGHGGRVRSIAFSSDGTLVATGSDDSAVRVWDTATFACLATLRGHADRVSGVAFDPGGAILAGVSRDGTARLWDHRSGDLLHTFTGDGGRLRTAAFNQVGTLLATAGDGLTIDLWDPRTGEHLHALSGHTRRVNSVAFSPVHPLVASASDDGTIILWDLAGESPAHLATLLGLPDGWAALTPDGRYKQEGEVLGEFWYAVNMVRFAPGELDAHLPTIRRLATDAGLS
jgi:WD40 repeat protein/transcriptional regulator with XRE-family HTH domain